MIALHSLDMSRFKMCVKKCRVQNTMGNCGEGVARLDFCVGPCWLAGGCLVASWNRHDSRVLYGTQDGSPAVVPMSVIGQFRLVVSTVIEKTKIRLYRRHRRICQTGAKWDRYLKTERPPGTPSRNALQPLLEHPPASLGVLTVTGSRRKIFRHLLFYRRLLQAWKTT